MSGSTADRFVFNCPKCAVKLRALSSQSGRELKCPGCKSSVLVPNAIEPKPEATDLPKDFVAPTAKQVDFANELGIVVTSEIDRRTLSRMIDEALLKKETERYDLLYSNNEKENELRKEIRAEVISEIDEEDPRVSVATIEQILQALDERQIGAIIILHEYGEMSGEDDFTGKTFEMKSTDDLDEEDIRRIISMLGFSFIRRGTSGS